MNRKHVKLTILSRKNMWKENNGWRTVLKKYHHILRKKVKKSVHQKTKRIV